MQYKLVSSEGFGGFVLFFLIAYLIFLLNAFCPWSMGKDAGSDSKDRAVSASSAKERSALPSQDKLLF